VMAFELDPGPARRWKRPIEKVVILKDTR
jgi:hypothetical protein